MIEGGGGDVRFFIPFSRQPVGNSRCGSSPALTDPAYIRGQARGLPRTLFSGTSAGREDRRGRRRIPDFDGRRRNRERAMMAVEQTTDAAAAPGRFIAQAGPTRVGRAAQLEGAGSACQGAPRSSAARLSCPARGVESRGGGHAGPPDDRLLRFGATRRLGVAARSGVPDAGKGHA